MAVVPLSSTLIDEGNTAVSLALYANSIQYPPNAFFGVAKNDELTRYCDRIWMKSERDTIAFYLAEAQEEVENEARYPLAPRWIVNEDHSYKFPVVAKWKKVIVAGVKNTDKFGDSEAVNHANDPVEITIATAIANADEVRVFYEDLDIEIIPSSVVVDGVNAVIKIPRCRLVKPDLVDNPEEGLDYTDTVNNFVANVDIWRIWNDPSTQGTLVWAHTCGGSTCTLCNEYTQDGCMYIADAENSVFEVLPASYSGGTWSSVASCCTGKPDRVKLNYRAGLATLTKQARDVVIMLAHAKMPTVPCGCDQVTRLWKRDRNKPGVLTKERINCPFGMSDGAWVAWRFTQAMRKVGMGIA